MENKKLNIREKLVKIQTELKVPKEQRNNFGNYNFRSCEDILEKLKPLEAKYNVFLVLSDEVVLIGNNPLVNGEEEYWDEDARRVLRKTTVATNERFYIKATATLYDADDETAISNTAYAREEDAKKGMDASQITGTASSYARKYALNGLFGLDDVKDADTDAFAKITSDTKEITLEEAEKYVFNFGKHKSETLKEVYKKFPDYIDWLIENGKADATLKKCIEILDKPKPEDRLTLFKEMKDLEIKTNSVHEKLLSNVPIEEKTPYDF